MGFDLGSGSGAPNWDFGSGLESVDAKMVVICLAVTAWHFATISLLVGSRNGRNFPGCRTAAIPDHFSMTGHMIMVAIHQADTQWWIATVLLSLIRP